MATNILMPALSPTMEEGTVAKWLVKEGDTVASGDILAEIETDKATMEFEAVEEGILGKILVPEGSSGVKVNTPIAVMVDEGEDAEEVDLPDTDAPTPEAAPSAPAEQSQPVAAPPAIVKGSGERVFASPLARRLAEEHGINIEEISGSGPHGRVVKADVESASQKGSIAAPEAIRGSGAQKEIAPQPATLASSVVKIYEGREYEEVSLDGMRKTIAARLTEAKQTIPHFYLRRDVRLDALMELRAELNKKLESRSVKLSINDFVIKACATALQEVKDANAVWAGDRILRLKPSDVAVAVAIDGGLFTPILKDADRKSLSALSEEMKDLASRARDRKLAPHEYQGGSFAISNLGMFGIDNFDAVINPPHGAILAVGAGVKKPVVNAEGEIGIATIMSMTLSVDHRVIDGALGAKLLDSITRNLENPLAMLA